MTARTAVTRAGCSTRHDRSAVGVCVRYGGRLMSDEVRVPPDGRRDARVTSVIVTGFFHETAFYGSDDDFLAHAVPFLEDGLRAGEPSVVACTESNASLLRAALGDAALIYRP